ncbi:MFS transporter [Derxia gummosa]|uniref:MFS transporter n=1 Tax=Derxia gummosa DSM 723 TaxID=1121388 RepID=A0A8B6X4G2_9BURK|nr:MFS transporter [Derxia gummosa]
MSSIPVTHESASAGPARALVLLLAAGCGLAVASLYYSQPILALLGRDLGASERAVGLLPMLTQLGYAAGILLLTPLGDLHDRRRVILAKAVLLVLALLLSAWAPGFAALAVASALLGLVATLAQDIVPAAATLAPAERRGSIVGTVMTGLLLGILLSRVASGVIAAHWGWRAVYAGAAASIALVGLALARWLPSIPPTSTLPWARLIGSLGELWRARPELRRAAFAQGLLSVGFSAFWSTLAVMLDRDFGLGSGVAGAFGLAGAAGALAAPLAGRLADRRGPATVTRVGAALAAASFAAMALMPALPPQARLWLVAASAVGFDFGIQATLVAHQTIVFGLDPAARSRLNALLFVGVFVGMASGAALGSLALAQAGWVGVVLLAVLASVAALVVRLRG